MNLLALVQRTIQECGATGTSLSTVVGATGEELRFVTWVQQAWLELQTKHDDWLWMRSSALLGGGISVATQLGLAYYTLGTGAGTVGVLADSLGKWARGTFRLYTTATGFNDEVPLGEIGFDRWRNGYMMSSQRNVRTRPEIMAIGPGQEICLGPVPSAAYTFTGDYYRAPTVMAANGDTPTGLPLHFHMAIVYLAMTYHGQYDAAQEVLSRGQIGYRKLMGELEALRAPEVTGGSALA